ncbi:hypothetical protein L7F22_028530 [Adiantum nelumboides]|nr:hypothetical protein [Adiantum nelumboides]
MAFSLISRGSPPTYSTLPLPSASSNRLATTSSLSMIKVTPWARNFPILKLSTHLRRSHISSCSAPTSSPFSSSSEATSKSDEATSKTDEATSKSDEYNRTMQRQMRNPYEYHHDLGMYYTRLVDGLIVGSQPQTPEDVDKLYKDEGVRAILNLQQDRDIEYWGIDFPAITKRCDELGIQYMRSPARDFDPSSLRSELPKAVCLLDGAISQGKTVYVHCTAGLGRAPGVAITYLFWFNGMNLDGAYNFLTSKRPCGPKKEAIRGATYDLAKNDAGKEPFKELPEYAFADVASWERQLIQERVRNLR